MTPRSEEQPFGTDPRATLLRLRDALTAELETTREALQQIRQLRADRSDDDEHDPEGAPLSGEWSRMESMHRAALQRVRDVEGALANVDAGRYGTCARCHELIAPGRLEALPTAVRCVRCASSVPNRP